VNTTHIKQDVDKAIKRIAAMPDSEQRSRAIRVSVRQIDERLQIYRGFFD
jgi:hypothetical protein